MWFVWFAIGSVAAAGLSCFGLASMVGNDVVGRSIFYAHWLHLALLAQAVWLVAKEDRWTWSRIGREWACPLGVGIAAAAVIQCAIERDFRVLADETNLVGSSMSLYRSGTYQNVLEGYFYYDQFHPINTVLDKRPGLYSFLMYLLHCLLGYDAGHGFAVNFIASAATIMLVVRIGLDAGSLRYGLFGALALIGTPIFSLGATSSGFEVLNLLLLLATYRQAALFWERPSLPRLQMLVLFGLAAAEVRYESILVMLPIGIVALCRFRTLSRDRIIYTSVLLPLMVVPLNWQRTATSVLNEGDPATTSVFHLRHWQANLAHLGEYLFDPQEIGYPLSPLISALAVVGAALVVWDLWRRPDRNRRTIAALTVGTMLLIVSVQLAYYLGDPRQPAAQRIAVTYSGLLGLLAACTMNKVAAIPRVACLSWTLCVFLAFQGLSRAAADEQGKQLLIARQFKATLAFLKTQPRSGTLLVTDRPGLFAAYRYGAISPGRLVKNVEEIQGAIERKLFTNLLLEQRIYFDEAQTEKPAVPEGFSAETVHEFSNDAKYLVRISRLIPGDDAALME